MGTQLTVKQKMLRRLFEAGWELVEGHHVYYLWHPELKVSPVGPFVTRRTFEGLTAHEMIVECQEPGALQRRWKGTTC